MLPWGGGVGVRRPGSLAEEVANIVGTPFICGLRVIFVVVLPYRVALSSFSNVSVLGEE